MSGIDLWDNAIHMPVHAMRTAIVLFYVLLLGCKYTTTYMYMYDCTYYTVR